MTIASQCTRIKWSRLVASVCLAGLLTPVAGFAQPGRPFTPPPPPPQIPRFTPPPTFTPPVQIQAPQLFRQQVQQMQSSNQAMQHQNRIYQQTTSHFSQQQSLQQQAQFWRDRARQDPAYQGPKTNPAPAWQSSSGSRFTPAAPAENGGVVNLAGPPIVVVRVDANSQGDFAGVQPGDILVRYAGVPLQSIRHLRALRQLEHPGGPGAVLVVLRGGELVTAAMSPGRLGLWLRD
jgi:hypothetical protein